MRNRRSRTTVLWSWEYRDDDHPRPVEVARLEALLNTVDHHRFGAHAEKPAAMRDQLTGGREIKQWLVDHHLLDSDQRLGESDAIAVRAFRDGLRNHLENRREDSQIRTWPPPALRLRVRSGAPNEGLELVPVSEGVQGALERLLADAVVAEAKNLLQRLKVCAAPDCRFAYYDHSRSRTSRWCSMQTCGNRIKTRHYRRRQG